MPTNRLVKPRQLALWLAKASRAVLVSPPLVGEAEALGIDDGGEEPVEPPFRSAESGTWEWTQTRISSVISKGTTTEEGSTPRWRNSREIPATPVGPAEDARGEERPAQWQERSPA